MGFNYNVWGAVTGGFGLLVFFGLIRLGHPSYLYERLEKALERAERRIGQQETAEVLDLYRTGPGERVDVDIEQYYRAKLHR